MDLHGVGPVVAARILADVGDVARFADRNRFASWTGTAPLDASSGEQIRHRLSRAGNRRMNHMIHIAAVTQIRLDTDGRAYYRRKLADGKRPARGDALPQAPDLRRHLSTARRRRTARRRDRCETRVREGTAGRLMNPARPAHTRTPALRISHFPDPHQRRYARPRPGRKTEQRTKRSKPPVDNRREPMWVIIARTKPHSSRESDAWSPRADLAASPAELKQFQERTRGDSDELAKTQYRGRPCTCTDQLVRRGRYRCPGWLQQ